MRRTLTTLLIVAVHYACVAQDPSPEAKDHPPKAESEEKTKPEEKAEPEEKTKPEEKVEPEKKGDVDPTRIPTTLAEAHEELERILPKSELAKIDAMKSEKDTIEYHMGFAGGLRNGWGLWGDSPLARHMRELGFTHPDDMSSVIMETFWCKRHGKDFRIEERVEYYKAYWKETADPGEKAVDPDDGSKVSWFQKVDAEGRLHRTIHFGRSEKTKRILAFEHPVGVYVPDEAMLKKYNVKEALDLYLGRF